MACYNPHSFRRTIAHLAEKTCTTAEQFKAWSQNLGHENVGTTFSCYGTLSVARQGEIVKGFQEKMIIRDIESLSNNEIIKILSKRLT